ncbi:glycosyltransferase family 4 protein [Egbenema bharatensis]|uniref:glycosyltransferase family 4 protein n=1 Tax=Egbenema bharatensis TaxID=3463334 RepID=UPI003A866CCB
MLDLFDWQARCPRYILQVRGRFPDLPFDGSTEMKRVALLLHCDRFEGWFTRVLGFDKESYLNHYRNDFAWDYALGLRENGIEPIIYIASLQHQGLYHTHDGFQVRFLPLAPWYALSCRLPYFKRSRLGTYLQERVNAIALIGSLRAGLQDDQISVLYIQEYWTTRFDYLIEHLEIPIIGSDHGGNDALIIPVHKHRSLPKAYKLTCQTIEQVEKVRQFGGDAVFLPNGVDTEFYCPDSTIPRQEKLILTVARLTDRQKRTSDLIRALTYLDSDWRLDIVGTGTDGDRLRVLVQELNLSERVTFSGFVQDKAELRNRYQNCSLFALPSAAEGLPLVALEAMSCGTAVVTSNIPAFDHLVLEDKNGMKVPVGQPEALAQGILKCSENREQYGLAARQMVVSSYAKPQMFAQLANLIQHCPEPIAPTLQEIPFAASRSC